MLASAKAIQALGKFASCDVSFPPLRVSALPHNFRLIIANSRSEMRSSK